MSKSNLAKLINLECQSILYRNSLANPEEIINAQIDNCTVLWGSFNPIHDGHIKLLEAAHKVSQKERMIFELSINNKDKGLIDED